MRAERTNLTPVFNAIGAVVLSISFPNGEESIRIETTATGNKIGWNTLPPQRIPEQVVCHVAKSVSKVVPHDMQLLALATSLFGRHICEQIMFHTAVDCPNLF